MCYNLWQFCYVRGKIDFSYSFIYMYFAECVHLTRNERQIMICCIGITSLIKPSSLEQTHTCQMNIFYVKLTFGASTLWGEENSVEKKKKTKFYVMYYAK